MASGTARLERGHMLAAGAIVLLALCIRLTGIDRELPHRTEGDPYIVQHFQSFVHDPAVVKYAAYTQRYPSLLPRLFSLLPYPEIPAPVSGPGSEAVHLARAAWPYHVVRVGVALFSTLGVALTWLLARRFLSPTGALAAAFFLATSLLSILFSHQGRPHTPQATMALATTLLSLRVLEKPSFLRILLASAAAAGAAACLQNGMLAMLPLFCAVFLARRKPRDAERARWLGPLSAAGLACTAAAAVALCFYPQIPYVDSEGIHLGPKGGGAHTLFFRMMNFAECAGLRAAARFLWIHDPILSILAAAGAVLGLIGLYRRWRGGRTIDRGRRHELAVVAAYVLPYAAVLWPNPLVYERFLLPLYPYLACLAAGAFTWMLTRMREDLRQAWLQGLAGVVLGSVFLGLPLYLAVRYARVAAAPDRLELAADWIRTHVDPRSIILTSPGTFLPLLFDPEFTRINLKEAALHTMPWPSYQGVLPPGPDPARKWKVRILPPALAIGAHKLDLEDVEPWLVASDADYVVMETTRMMSNIPVTRALAQATQKLGERVYSSRGETPSLPGLGPGEYQGASAFATWVWSAEAFGPGIDIYRIRRDGRRGE